MGLSSLGACTVPEGKHARAANHNHAHDNGINCKLGWPHSTLRENFQLHTEQLAAGNLPFPFVTLKQRAKVATEINVTSDHPHRQQTLSVHNIDVAISQQPLYCQHCFEHGRGILYPRMFQSNVTFATNVKLCMYNHVMM